MKLFIREHLPLIAAHIVQLFLVLLIYWLDGYRNAPTAFYSMFLGFTVLTGYLIYRYLSHRAFYRRLSEPLQSLDESILSYGSAPLPMALDRLLKEQYKHYQGQLMAWEKKRNAHFSFMNQWVHQMKTPLSVIHLTVQESDDPSLASVREEAERMERGLETVLYAARLDAFEHDFKVERVSLLTAVEQVVHENKRSFIRNYVYPEVLIDRGLYVETDAKWLHFVINQLVLNAVKYSSGSNTKITFSTYAADPHAITLEIRDRGVGIPAADRRRIFQPFFTGENGRKFRESTGMGLYLVSEICKRLGHRIEIESEVGEGTAAKLSFASTANLTQM
jgi:two-component system, OmpR family, sensor histidine kinase YxdK